MKPGTDKIFSRAALAARRAEDHLESGHLDRAMERAYYAIFHAARAILAESGDRSRSHQAICEKMETLVPPPPPALHRALAHASRRRADGEAPLAEDVERLVALARAAVDAARVRLEAGEEATPRSDD